MDTLEFLKQKAEIIGKPPFIIPNAGRDQMAEWFCELGFTVGAEIGVKRGEYSEVLCKANPNLHLYSVDGWQAYENYRPGRQNGMDVYFAEASARLKPYNCTLVREFSVKAAKGFADNSLHFVFIDAAHDFVNVVNDIHTWQKKVRPSGIVAGHDFIGRPPKPNGDPNVTHRVVEAICGYTQSYGINEWFVLGRKRAEPGEIRDRERSWLWVKA